MSTNPGVDQTGNFAVRIDSTNTPVTPGNTLEVDATATNNGDATGTQEITLSIDGGQVDISEETLENGQSTEVTLTWSTNADDAGTYTAEVASTNDSEQTNVAVQPDDYDEDLQITHTNGPVTAGEPLCVNCSVENTGSSAGETTLAVGLGNQVEDKIKDKYALEPGDNGSLAVELGPEEYNRPGESSWEQTVWVESPTARNEATVSISQPPAFDVSIQSTNAPIVEGETLEVTASVENVGGLVGHLTAELVVGEKKDRVEDALSSTFIDTTTKAKKKKKNNRGAVDSRGLALDPGQSQEVTLEWEPEPGQDGEHAITVGAIPPWEEDEWDGPVFGRTPCGGGSPSDTGLALIDRHGPMRTGRFIVEIAGQEVTDFQSVTIPGKSVEQGSYREGNDPDYEKKVWGQTTYDDLEMERGVKPGATELHDWIKDIQAGQVDSGRKEIAVKMLDEEGNPMIRWDFQSAWIKEYSPPELDASADGDVATESATIAYDKMERKEV